MFKMFILSNAESGILILTIFNEVKFQIIMKQQTAEEHGDDWQTYESVTTLASFIFIVI